MYSMREIFVDQIRLTGSMREHRCTHQLISKQEHGLETELSIAEVEEIFETGPKEIQDHGIVVAFRSEPPDKGNTDATGQCLVDLGLILELRVLCLCGFELDGDLFAGDDVDAEVDIA